MAMYGLWIYLGGLALRAFLAHGAMQNPTASQSDLDAQMISCILWPIALIKRIFKGSL